jgi:hypothetical protein
MYRIIRTFQKVYFFVLAHHTNGALALVSKKHACDFASKTFSVNFDSNVYLFTVNSLLINSLTTVPIRTVSHHITTQFF